MMIKNPFGDNNGKPRYGVCPFTSTTTAIPEAIPGGVIGAGPGQQAVTVRPLFMPAPCLAEDCQLWDGSANMCALKGILAVSNALEKMIPPTGAGGDSFK